MYLWESNEKYGFLMSEDGRPWTYLPVLGRHKDEKSHIIKKNWNRHSQHLHAFCYPIYFEHTSKSHLGITERVIEADKFNLFLSEAVLWTELMISDKQEAELKLRVWKNPQQQYYFSETIANMGV